MREKSRVKIAFSIDVGVLFWGGILMKRYFREDIFARDRQRCVACRSKKYQLVAHHVIPEAQGGADNEQNIVSLCRPCHMQATGFRMYKDVERDGIKAIATKYLQNLFGNSWNPYSPQWTALRALAGSICKDRDPVSDPGEERDE